MKSIQITLKNGKGIWSNNPEMCKSCTMPLDKCTHKDPLNGGYYECNYGSCCGYKCQECGKFI